MPTPQPAFLPEGPAHALFLVLRAREPGRVAEVLRGAQALADGIGGDAVDPRLAIGIGAGFWDLLEPKHRPAKLRPFARVEGGGGLVAPDTGGDLFLHIASDRHDLNFELMRRLMGRLAGMAHVIEEVHGFRYLDTRDLTGFIDGTENPEGKDAAEATLIGDEDDAFRAGSYVAAMRFIHDLARWERLPVPEQEGVVGRTKADSVELPDKPATAHISRVVIEEQGEELEILRRSYPYGNSQEAGLYFVAYGRTPDHFDAMLRRMMGVADDGLHDRLMEFTRPVSGASFFVPSMEILSGLGA